MGHQGLQFLSVLPGNLCQTTIDGLAEFKEGSIVAAVERLLFDELPQPLDQVQIGRIRRQKLQADVQALGQIHHQGAMLIAGVVQHHGDRPLQPQHRDFAEQGAHGFGGDGGLRRDADQFVRHRVPGSQHAVALTSRGASNEQPGPAPDTAQERPHHEMSRVHEEDVAFAGTRLIQQRL